MTDTQTAQAERDLDQRDRAIAEHLIESVAEFRPATGCGAAVLRALERAGYVVMKPRVEIIADCGVKADSKL